MALPQDHPNFASVHCPILVAATESCYVRIAGSGRSTAAAHRPPPRRTGEATLPQLAASVGVALNTARSHVQALDEARILERRERPLGGRGRPVQVYRLVTDWMVPTTDFTGTAAGLSGDALGLGPRGGAYRGARLGPPLAGTSRRPPSPRAGAAARPGTARLRRSSRRRRSGAVGLSLPAGSTRRSPAGV